jgi:hypothetical protein
MTKQKLEALDLMKQDGMNLRLLPEELRNDKDVVLAAVNHCKYALQFASEELQKDEDISGLVEKNDSYFWHIVNPRTGDRYDIPMLSPVHPEYYFKYIYNMKIRETSPDTFEKMLRWN